MLDYKLIEALAMVVEEQGFERAARRLHLTQSAVSQRLRQLEEKSGQVLLARTTPPHATEAGQRLLKHYHQVKLLEDGLALAETPKKPVTLAIGINADSLASWFLEAISPLLAEAELLIDLHVDDQEQTHRLLREGTAVGCISDEPGAMQGCRVDPLGSMIYRLLATPDFQHRWFPDRLTAVRCSQAPAVIFNRKDNLHHSFLDRALDDLPHHFPRHYLPSPEAFLQLIRAGCAYGMVPDWQGAELLQSGELIELRSDITLSVELFWHRWNLDSPTLESLSERLIRVARDHLA